VRPVIVGILYRIDPALITLSYQVKQEREKTQVLAVAWWGSILALTAPAQRIRTWRG